MRYLALALALLANSAFAQQPNGTINAPIYATGYISQVGGASVTTKIPAQSNHPTNLNIYTTSAISGTWTIQLPNPAFEGQILSFSCGATVNTISIISTDGSSIDSNLPTTCVGASTFSTQFDQRANIWRNIGYSSSAGILPTQLPAFTGGDCTTPSGSVVISCYFTQSGSGAVTRSVSSKLRETISITDFVGADPTGTSNSLSACQAAVAYAVEKTNTTVYFPNGSYLISGGTCIVTAGSGVALRGESSSSVIIINGNTNAPALRIGDNVSFDYGNQISGLSFATKNGVVGVVGQYGLAVYKQGHFKFRDLKFTNSPAALYDGMILSGSSQVIASAIEAQNTLHTGITIFGAVDTYVDAARSDGNASNGWTFSGSNGVYLNNLSGYNNGVHAFEINGSVGDNNSFFVTNAIADTSGSDNWYISNLGGSHFTNVWGSTQTSTGVNTFAAGFLLTTNKVHTLDFVSCHALYNNGFGINLYDPTGASAADSPYDIRLTNCQLGTTVNPNGRAGFGYGVAANGAANVTIISGQFQGNTSGAMGVSNSASYIARSVSGLDDTSYKQVTLAGSTIAGLPTCDASLIGTIAAVTDGTAYGTGAYGSAVSATGIVTRKILCTNTAGATTYAWAYD